MKIPRLFLLSGAVASLWLCGLSAQAAVFGADNRHAVTETSPALQLARSTAIAVLSANFAVNNKGLIDLDTDRLTNLCSGELMAGEPSLSYSCTGFLVAPDLLATAGHCVYAVNTPNQTLEHETKLACETFSWLFDYQATSSAPAALKNLSPDRLFHCKEIIYARQTERAPFVDYALIRLDRPALGRTPFKISSAPVMVGDAVAMVGYPFGTPVKYTDAARVTLNNLKRDSFLTSLDAFEGNSGSPVFNSAHDVVGILIGGTPSANTYTPRGLSCERVNRCTENGSSCDLPDTDTSVLPGYQGVGSEVQRIEPIETLLHEHGSAGRH
jgi:hypothetical protein